MVYSDSYLGPIVKMKADYVREKLKAIPDPERISLKIAGIPLLNVVAKDERHDLIVVLLELGLLEWNHCDEGSRVFFLALKRYLVRDIDIHFHKYASHSKLLKAFNEFFELLEKKVTNKTRFIQKLLKQHPTWCSLMFRGRPVQRERVVDDVSYSKEISDAIGKGDVDAVWDILRLPQMEEKCPQYSSLLSLAAHARQSEIMALLIQHGALQWSENKRDNEFFALTLEVVTKRDIEVLFPQLYKRSGLGACFDEFFREIREDTLTTTSTVKSLLNNHPDWLISMLSRPALVFTRFTNPSWFEIFRTPTIEAIGEGISWSLDSDPGSAREWNSGRSLFMDQTLIGDPIEIELIGRNEEPLDTIKVSGTTGDLLGSITIVYRKYILDRGFTLYFQGIHKASWWRDSYYLAYGT